MKIHNRLVHYIVKKIKISFIPSMLHKLISIECRIATSWVSLAHKRLLIIGKLSNMQYFDHNIDLFYQWRATRNPMWLERGIFGCLTLKGEDLLELSCGDGFNSRNFYSFHSKKVVACDISPIAIKTAKDKNKASNVQFILADVRTNMPKGQYDNIILDAAMEYFTKTETNKLFEDIKNRLTDTGILSGYTVILNKDGTKSVKDHKHVFIDKEDLLKFLLLYFNNATVFETTYHSRCHLYFWASNSHLPFNQKWSNSLSKNIESTA